MSSEPSPDDIVGHKTYRVGPLPGDVRHEPLTRAEADAMLAAHDAHVAERAARWPDEQAALDALTDAFGRLKELGWSEAMYCPKDGSSFDVIEAGSSGIHSAYYEGKWPSGAWFVEAEGDLWPSTPILYRVSEAQKARWAAFRAAWLDKNPAAPP